MKKLANTDMGKDAMRPYNILKIRKKSCIFLTKVASTGLHIRASML